MRESRSKSCAGVREGGREKERESERGKKRRNVTKVAISFADTIPVLGNGELL